MTLTAPTTSATDRDGGSPRSAEDLLRALPAELVAGIRISADGRLVRLQGEVADEVQVSGARPLRGTGWTERVARSIAATPGIEGSVAVQIDDGVVTLWGHVPNGRIRERVIEAVREVVGGAWIQMRIVTD